MKIRVQNIQGVTPDKGEPYWVVDVAAWEGGCACEAKAYLVKIRSDDYPTAKQIKSAIKNIVEPKDL